MYLVSPVYKSSALFSGNYIGPSTSFEFPSFVSRQQQCRRRETGNLTLIEPNESSFGDTVVLKSQVSKVSIPSSNGG